MPMRSKQGIRSTSAAVAALLLLLPALVLVAEAANGVRGGRGLLGDGEDSNENRLLQHQHQHQHQHQQEQHNDGNGPNNQSQQQDRGPNNGEEGSPHSVRGRGQNDDLVVPGSIGNGNGNGKPFEHINQNEKFKPIGSSAGSIAGRWIIVLSADTEIEDAQDKEAKDKKIKDKIKDKAARHKGRPDDSIVFDKILHGGVIEGMDAAEAAALAQEDDVELVVQDAQIYLEQGAGISWGQDRMDQAYLPLDGLYSPPNGGAGVTAYVIDGRVRTTHDEFEGRASVGQDFTNQDTSNCPAGSPLVATNHGTHVAGIIGGKTYGIAADVDIISLVVFNCEGAGSWSWAIAAMNWAANDCANKGVRCVANLSIGSPTYGPADTAANNLWDSGVFVSVAAGNQNVDACGRSPARAEKVCSVGSTDKSDNRSTFWAGQRSNYGTCVDIFAPGGGDDLGDGIFSGDGILSAIATSDNALARMHGTSMAAPHLAGLAALHFNANPTQSSGDPTSPDDVLSTILADSTQGAVVDIGPGSPDRMASLGCSPPCGVHGHCSSKTCVCEPGWQGQTCDCPSFPTTHEWYIITNDECNDGRSFGINEDITIIYYNPAIDHSTVKKIETMFEVLGDGGRKTKFKLDSLSDLSIEEPSFPRYYAPDNTYRLTMRMGEIGQIGGWDGKWLDNPDEPIHPGEWTTFKLKIQDSNERYEIFVDDESLYATDPIPDDHPCFTSGDPNYCNDGDLCTSDVCHQTLGCVNTPLPLDCSYLDSTCTLGACDATSGYCEALPLNEGGTCNDGDACTIDDTCQSGTCVGGPPKSCNDGNECTDDSCNPLSGCVYAPNDNQCSDDNACTVGDKCAGGVCQPGLLTTCPNNDPCKINSCNPTSGACESSSVQDGASCSDGIFCNGAEQCSGGICMPSAALCLPGEICVEDESRCVECLDDTDCDLSANEKCDETNHCVDCLTDTDCTQGQVCSVGGACISACSLPNKSTWLVIGRNGQQPCSEIRNVELTDQLTMIFFHEDVVDANELSSLEVDLKVNGKSDRRTKWKIESNFFDTSDSDDLPLPHAYFDGTILLFRLVIDVDLIGGIGGTEDADNDPVKSGEYIEWKWKVRADSGVQLDSDDDISEGAINVL